MASEDGPAADHLSFFARMRNQARLFGAFPLLRAAEARADGALPRIGRARSPKLNIAELAHAPSMDFPGPTIESVDVAPSGRYRVRSRFLGLTGPMGPLPLHLTEYAQYEGRYSKSQPFTGFLDLVSGRMLQFFYRAWADSQPAAQADRPNDDGYAAALARLTGAWDGVTEEAWLPRKARLDYAAMFVGHRSAAALQDAFSHLFGTPVRIREYVGRWRPIAAADQTAIGALGHFNVLGGGAIVGSRIHTLDDTFRVVVTAMNFCDYRAMLPTGRWFKVAREALSSFAPSHLDWQLELEIAQNEIEPARLDSMTQLGWSSWMAPTRDSTQRRADARLCHHH